MTHRSLVAGGALALVIATTGAARAQDANKTAPVQPTPSVILNLMNQPVTPETRDKAFNESVKRDALAPRPSPLDDWEPQPDGSMRNKRSGVSMIVRNPCPPGDVEHELALAAYNQAMSRRPRR